MGIAVTAAVTLVSAGVPVTVRAGRPELLDGEGADQPNCTGMLTQPANLDSSNHRKEPR